MLCPGTGRKKTGIYPPVSSFPDFCQGIRHAADFGPGFPDHLPQNTTVKPAAGRFIRYTQHIAGQPTGQDMLNTIADQVHFHRRKTCSPVQDGIEHHGQVFVIFIEPARVIAFLHDQAKAARLADQQRLTGGGQRRPDTPRIFCHLVTDASYCIAHRIKNCPDFVFGQPYFSTLMEKIPGLIPRFATCRLSPGTVWCPLNQGGILTHLLDCSL